LGIITPELQKICFSRAALIWNSIQDGTFTRFLADQNNINLVLLAAADERWY